MRRIAVKFRQNDIVESIETGRVMSVERSYLIDGEEFVDCLWSEGRRRKSQRETFPVSALRPHAIEPPWFSNPQPMRRI
jgi:hypothetical protein